MDEELLARQTPQALEAEQSVLGSMLIDERCVPDVVGMLQPEDFYLRQNREIYETSPSALFHASPSSSDCRCCHSRHLFRMITAAFGSFMYRAEESFFGVSV